MVSSGKAKAQAAREARLAAALRENLKRRKAQARARARAAAADGQTASAGTTPHPEAPDFRRNQGCD